MNEPDSIEDKQETWQQRYEQGATGWDRGAANPMLLGWLAQGVLHDVNSIAVPGCGRGHEVVELADRGFKVTAIDFAPAAIEALSGSLAKRHLTAELIQASIFDYEPASPFDVIYEQTCLCAILPKQREEYERRLARWLKPNGTLLALFMQTHQTGGPPFHCALDEMKVLFDPSRWDWSVASQVVSHPSGLEEIAIPLKRKESTH